jgi:hypothetical protein
MRRRKWLILETRFMLTDRSKKILLVHSSGSQQLLQGVEPQLQKFLGKLMAISRLYTPGKEEAVPEVEEGVEAGGLGK